MNRSEHLSENQLQDYFGNSALDREAKHEIGRHLLQCDFCLKRLPQPTAEQFWTALMTENEDSGDERTSLAARLEFIVQLFKQPKIFAISTAALAVVLFFSAFIWLNAAKSSEAQNEVAQNFEVKDSQPVFNQTGNVEIEKLDAFPKAESNIIPSAPARGRVIAKQEPTRNSNAPKQNLKTGSQSDFNLPTPAKSPGAEKTNISSTRGGLSTLPKCGSETGVEMTTGGNGEAVRLKWKKVPKAAKYHLYVSDDDEILVDEYETEQETSYVLKKPLDSEKTYKWKVVITLEDGNTVIGDSQKFTIKSLEFKRKSGRKEKSEIRCSQQD